MPRSLQVVLLLLPLSALLLFINKPFHIDDVAYLRQAEMLPYTFLGEAWGRVEWQGVVYPRLSAYESTHPPLVAYFLKWAHLFGGAERFWVYHLFFLVFPFLMLRWVPQKTFEANGFWPLFVLFSPSFFVNATNLMTDVPLAVFWLLTMVFGWRYSVKRETGRLLGTVLCLSAALFTAYQALCLAPLLALCLYFNGGFRPRDGWLVIPFLLLGLFLLFVFWTTGFFPYLAHNADYHIADLVAEGAKSARLANKAFSIVVNMGFALVFVTPVFAFVKDGKRSFYALICALACYWMLFQRIELEQYLEAYKPLEQGLLKLLVCLGFYWLCFIGQALVRAGRAWFQDRSGGLTIILGFWFFGVVCYNLLLPMGSGRYLLPAVPAAVVLALRAVDTTRFRAPAVALLLCAALASMLLARVDAQRARADKLFADELARCVDDPSRLYFSDDFGLNRYLNRLGAHYLPMNADGLRPGDLVLVSRDKIPETVAPYLSVIREFEMPSYLGLVLYDRVHRAGFYNSIDGFLPFNAAATTRRAVLCRVSLIKMAAGAWRMETRARASLEERVLANGLSVESLSVDPGGSVVVPLGHEAGSCLSGIAYLDRARNGGSDAVMEVRLEAVMAETKTPVSLFTAPLSFGDLDEGTPFDVALPVGLTHLRVKVVSRKGGGCPVFFSHFSIH